MDQWYRRTWIRGTGEHISGGQQSIDQEESRAWIRRRAEHRLGGEQSIDKG
jgi:hypothetical protein